MLGYFPNPWNAEKLSAATRFFRIAETITLSMAHFYIGSASMYPVLVLLPAFDAGSFYVIVFLDKDPPCAAWQLSCLFLVCFYSPVTLLIPNFEGIVYLHSGCSFSKISPCAATLFCSKSVTCRQLKACFDGCCMFSFPCEICAKNMMVSLKCRWYPSGRTDTKRNSVTEVTLSSENMKLSYFQKILFYEPRPKKEAVFSVFRITGQP